MVRLIGVDEILYSYRPIYFHCFIIPNQLANVLNRILHRLQSNRIYAQVIALFVVCIVYSTAIVNIVSTDGFVIIIIIVVVLI